MCVRAPFEIFGGVRDEHLIAEQQMYRARLCSNEAINVFNG
jgi:hypothetical protein